MNSDNHKIIHKVNYGQEMAGLLIGISFVSFGMMILGCWKGFQFWKTGNYENLFHSGIFLRY